MTMLVAGGVVLWLLTVIAVLGLCRGATVGLAVAATTVAAVPGRAQARQIECPDRMVPYQQAPAAVRAAIACEIDRVRVSKGLRWLRDDGRLQLAARRHSADMVRRDYFSHDSLSGDSPSDRARRTGYVRAGCSWSVGEVLFWGAGSRSTAARTVRAWLDSPGHRQIILSPSYADGGVGARAGTPAGHASGVTVTMVVGRRKC
jgi:uncharacterized protein YkwD